MLQVWEAQPFSVRADRFGAALPRVGAPLDLAGRAQGDLYSEIASARRMGALYWPSGFASSIGFGFGFDCEVYSAYDVNAVATFADGRHWAAVSTSLIFALAELSVRLAAILPLPHLEEAPVTVASTSAGFRFRQRDFPDTVASASSLFDQAKGFGPVRRRLMNALWLDAQVLVWRHELFHCALGHTRLLKSILGLSTLSEAPMEDTDDSDREISLLVRALEFHADWAAIGSMLRVYLSGHDPSGSDLAQGLGPTGRASVLMTAFLMLPVFLRAGEVRGGRRSLRHPSASARALTFLARINEIPDSEQRAAWEAGAETALRVLRPGGGGCRLRKLRLLGGRRRRRPG